MRSGYKTYGLILSLWTISFSVYNVTLKNFWDIA